MASIKKIKERKYKITVSNGYRLDGRKISKARTITVPNSVSKRGIGQFVAHAAEEFERTVKNGFGEDAETPFQKYAEAWLKRQVKYAPSTLASYERMLKVTYPSIGHIPLCKLRPIALENMLNELRQREYRGKKIQEETVQKYLTVVSAVLSDAKRNEIIQKNPARMIDLPATAQRTQVIPTPEQAREFLDAICNEPILFRTYYFLAIYTGCRRGELAALQWDDFTMKGDAAILTIRRSRSVVAGQGVMEGKTKNGKARQIYIEPTVIGILQTLYLHEKKYNSNYVFVNEQGKPFHPDTFTKHLRKIYNENGFPEAFHLHTLRHYFVTCLLHRGVDKQTVAELAGHGDTSFLERTYCHPQMERKQTAAKLLLTELLPGESA